MSDDRPSSAEPESEARSVAPGNLPTRSSRSLWTAWRHLLWTSTVASACTTTRVQTAPVPEPLPSGQRGEIRLSLRSGQVVSMYNATIVQDSIIGMDRPSSAENPQRVAVARADVDTVATKKLSVGKTVLAAVGGAFATLTFVVLVACASLGAA